MCRRKCQKFAYYPSPTTAARVILARQSSSSKKTTTFPSRSSPKRFSLFHVDCSAVSSTLGTPRGRPSFPGLDTCLHFISLVLRLRQERAANFRRLRYYRQTLDTCFDSIAGLRGEGGTSADIQRELDCWPFSPSRFVTIIPRHFDLCAGYSRRSTSPRILT